MEGIRVIRILEYTYADAKVAESDMARWTHSAPWSNKMTMRSVVMPYETIDFKPVDEPVCAEYQMGRAQCR